MLIFSNARSKPLRYCTFKKAKIYLDSYIEGGINFTSSDHINRFRETPETIKTASVIII